jgi:hypothetical protein
VVVDWHLICQRGFLWLMLFAVLGLDVAAGGCWGGLYETS